MMAISTSGIGKLDILQPASRVKGKGDGNADGSFSGLMDLVKAGGTDKQAGITQDNRDVTNLGQVSDGKQTAYKDEAVKTDRVKTETKQETKTDAPADKKTDTDVTEKTVQTETAGQGTETVKQIDETVEIPEEILAAVIEELTQLLTQTLDVSEEELTGLLEENGISLGELLDPETAKQFVLDVNAKTDVDLLTDENLADTVTQLTDAVQTIVEEYDIEEPADFAKALQTFEEKQVAPEDVQAEVRPEREPVETVITEDVQTAEVSAKPERVTDEPKRETRTETQDKQTETVTVNDTKVTVTTQTESTTYRDTKDHSQGDTARDMMNNLNQAVADAVGETTEVNAEVPGVSQADIITQVIDEVKANVNREVRSLEVVLNPEQLGKVHIAVENRNGIMQARIVAETEAARAAIENGIASLRETFENQGLKVDAVEVMVGNYEFFRDPDAEQNAEANNRSGNGNRRENGNDEAPEETPEETNNEAMRARGSSVSYTA